jgi:alpha-glucosidase (family GH31 glycosyl hydrolase)
MRRHRAHLAISLALAFAAATFASACKKSSDASPVDAGPAECAQSGVADPAASPRHTPRWAFEPWISKDISTGPDTYDFVGGFQSRDIPVGVVVLDSPWETNYTTFVPNEARYPRFSQIVADMHARGVRVVLWTTQMVNQSSFDLEPGGDTYPGASPNFDLGQRCGFFANQGETSPWWKGSGAALDFFSAPARAWWHAQQDALLATGFDGYKLDFGESYITTQPIATAAGTKALEEYSQAYYADFLAYGRAVRGPDFLTMTRAWDESYGFTGRFYAKKEDAPVAWAGDNRRDWVGLADALDTIFRSARAGYGALGSDIGGYLDKNDKDLLGPTIPFSQTVFARWTAVGALSPLMQLHGRGNYAPWTVPERPDETVALYHDWAKLHHELVPFLYSVTEESYAGAPTPIAPIGDDPLVTPPGWQGDFRYVLGGAFLVAPILDDTGIRDVPLPAGDAWYDYWKPTADALPGGQTLKAYDASDRKILPLFVRQGSIVPMVSELRVWPGPKPSRFVLHDTDDALTTIDLGRSGAASTVALSRALGPTVLRVRADVAVTTVTLAGAPLSAVATQADLDAAASGWLASPSDRTVLVKVPKAAGATTLTLQ